MRLPITYPPRSFEFSSCPMMLLHTPSLFPISASSPPSLVSLDGFGRCARTVHLAIPSQSIASHCSIVALLILFPALAFGKRNSYIDPAQLAIYYTAPPTPPLITIFYIFYRPTPRTLRILLFSEFLFQTVQNVDASFLYSVPMLSLPCSPPFVSLAPLPRAECAFSPVSGPSLSPFSPMVSLVTNRVSTRVSPPTPLFSLAKPRLEHVPVTVPSDFSRSPSVTCQ